MGKDATLATEIVRKSERKRLGKVGNGLCLHRTKWRELTAVASWSGNLSIHIDIYSQIRLLKALILFK